MADNPKAGRGEFCYLSGFLDLRGRCRNPNGCTCDTITKDRDRITALEDHARALAEALGPFAAFAAASSFDKVPDDLAMTQGSRFAHRQVTAGDFKRASAALAKHQKIMEVK
jgi:hypothetical protein